MKNGVFAIVIMVLFASCSGMMSETKEGNGNLVKETKTITSFDAIDVSNAINVFVKMGEKENIEIEADDNIQEYINAEVENGTLQIYIEQGIKIKNSKTNVYVTAVNLEGVNASASAYVSILDTIKTKSFKCNVSSAANVDVNLDTENFNAEASSAGAIEVKGKTDDAYLNASSAGNIEADYFEAQSCNANASSGADIKAWAAESLTADASSGGSISYKGLPTKLKKNSSSGGTIKQD